MLSHWFESGNGKSEKKKKKERKTVKEGRRKEREPVREKAKSICRGDRQVKQATV